MKFGMSIIVRGDAAGPQTFDAMGRKAEETGLDTLWASDHLLMLPMLESRYPGTADGQMPEPWKRTYYQPFSVLNWLAGRTTKVRLGTSVLILPMRNPPEMAAQLAELDVVSGGRLNVGIGVGWYKEEYEALGYSFETRGRRCDEGLAILKRLWTGEPANWHGTTHHFEGARLGPSPVQRPHPPIYIGGHTPAAIRRVARFGDVWHPFKLTPADVAGLLPVLNDALAVEGRSTAGFGIAPKVTLVIRDTPHTEGEPPTHGTPQQIVDAIHRYQDLGVTELCFDIAPETCANALESMERFAADIRPKL